MSGISLNLCPPEAVDLPAIVNGRKIVFRVRCFTLADMGWLKEYMEEKFKDKKQPTWMDMLECRDLPVLLDVLAHQLEDGEQVAMELQDNPDVKRMLERCVPQGQSQIASIVLVLAKCFERSIPKLKKKQTNRGKIKIWILLLLASCTIFLAGSLTYRMFWA